MVAMATGSRNNINYDIKLICNKILGKVTKFGEKRTKPLGVANRFMLGGTLGLYRVAQK